MEGWRKYRSIREAIDDLICDAPEEFYLAVSTAFSYLSLFLGALRINFEVLGLGPDKLTTAMSLLEVEDNPIARFFDEDLPWRHVSRRVLIPP